METRPDVKLGSMCEFPAAEMLKMRRQLAKQADGSGDAEFGAHVGLFIVAMDRLRMRHLDLKGCPCWENALKELANPRKGATCL